VLLEAGLVTSRRRGGNIVYSLQTSVLQDIVAELAGISKVGATPDSPPAAHATRRPQRA
jgi:DNA-binding transcriptional ArsR family regulator